MADLLLDWLGFSCFVYVELDTCHPRATAKKVLLTFGLGSSLQLLVAN